VGRKPPPLRHAFAGNPDFLQREICTPPYHYICPKFFLLKFSLFQSCDV
jgi:hypothetical protein